MLAKAFHIALQGQQEIELDGPLHVVTELSRYVRDSHTLKLQLSRCASISWRLLKIAERSLYDFRRHCPLLHLPSRELF